MCDAVETHVRCCRVCSGSLGHADLARMLKKGAAGGCSKKMHALLREIAAEVLGNVTC